MPPRDAIATRDPRSRLLCGRPESVSDEDLLGVLVGRRGAAALGSIVSEHGGRASLWRLSADELISVRGVGPSAAARVLACMEMSRRATCPSIDERPLVSSPEDVVALCGPQMRGLDKEHFWALALNTKNRLVRTIEVSVGSLNASIVHPRELFREAVRASAASVIVVHNHPSGDPQPSGADIQLTRRLVRAGDVLGVEVLDHVIVGDGGLHVSMRDHGLM